MKKVVVLFVTVIVSFLGDTTNAFTCQEKGIFPNTDSNDCKTFVTCDSDLYLRVRDCDEGSYFWPEEKGCFCQYNCTANSMLGNTNPCEGFTYDRIPDKYSTDCSRYLYCSLTYARMDHENILLPQVTYEECQSGQAFSPEYGCSDPNRYQCVNYECISEGVFENPNDCSTFIQCKKYTSRSYQGNSILYPDLINCPPNTKFNPHLKKCDGFYNCDGIDPHNGIDPCFNYNQNHPLVVNPYDNDASSYLECQHNYYPRYDAYKDVILQKECPADTLFSPILGKCYNNYDPEETCSKDPCSSGPGKYVNYQSGLCDSYIVCRADYSAKYEYEPYYELHYCPPGTRFSPETSKCSRQYVCPTFPENYCYPQIPTTTPAPTTPAPTTAATTIAARRTAPPGR